MGLCGTDVLAAWCNAHMHAGDAAAPQERQLEPAPTPGAPENNVLRRLLQQLQCGGGTHRCGTRCVSNSDPKTCGKRCSPCPAPASGNGVAACSPAGACTISCRKGFQAGQECATPKSCKPVCRRVCPAGQQADASGSACVVCPADTFKPRAGGAACVPCPAGTQARGQRASDHDTADDCKSITSCPAGELACWPLASCCVQALLSLYLDTC